MNKVDPHIGSWYKMLDQQVFRVITADDSDAFIEIQYMDGASELLERSTWGQLHLTTLENPPTEWPDLDRYQEEPDFDALGVAPGTEGLEYLTKTASGEN